MRFFKDYRVGENFQTDSRTITPEEVDRFVEYIGVRNPLFLDPKQASKGPFKTRIVPGFLTQSLALGLLYRPEIIEYFLLVEARTRFLKPVHIGDSIHVDGKVSRKKTRPNDKAGLLTLQTQIINQDFQRVADMTLTISILKPHTQNPKPRAKNHHARLNTKQNDTCFPNEMKPRSIHTQQ